MKKFAEDDYVEDFSMQEMLYKTREENRVNEALLNKQVDIAKNMLSKQFDIKTISEITGINKQKLKQIKMTML